MGLEKSCIRNYWKEQKPEGIGYVCGYVNIIIQFIAEFCMCVPLSALLGWKIPVSFWRTSAWQIVYNFERHSAMIFFFCLMIFPMSATRPMDMNMLIYV